MIVSGSLMKVGVSTSVMLYNEPYDKEESIGGQRNNGMVVNDSVVTVIKEDLHGSYKECLILTDDGRLGYLSSSYLFNM